MLTQALLYTLPLLNGQILGASNVAPFTVWDGANHIKGVGWTSPLGPESSIVAGLAAAGSHTTEITYYTSKRNTFVECGWQWAPWSPPFLGTDLSRYDTLELSIRIDGPHVPHQISPNLPSDVALSLASPGDHKVTERGSLKSRDPKVMDGKWHQIFIPLKSLYTSQMKFDKNHATQVILGAWNGPAGDFTVSIRKLAFVKWNR